MLTMIPTERSTTSSIGETGDNSLRQDGREDSSPKTKSRRFGALTLVLATATVVCWIIEWTMTAVGIGVLALTLESLSFVSSMRDNNKSAADGGVVDHSKDERFR
jgi:hypothetical protein